MAIQLSTAVRNARADATETTIGTAPILRIRTGAPPANVAAASTGTVLAELTLPSDWLAAASGGAKTLLGTWQDASANAAGTAGHFEITASDGTTRHMQGTITVTGGTGDLTLDDITIEAGQTVTITSFTPTEANA